MKKPPAAEIQEYLCGLAEMIARDHYATTLDFSVNSICDVEMILGKIHEYYAEEHNDDGLHGIALEFAAYIVTVIQKHFGPAEWKRDCKIMGKDSFPLYWRDSKLYPYGWCIKRIFDGPGDSVLSKFKTLVTET